MWSQPSDRRYAQRSSIAFDREIAVVQLAADLTNVTSLRTIRKRLLTGLVNDLGMDAAAVWIPFDRDGGLGMREQVGLPHDVAGSFGQWPSGSLPDRLLRDGMNGGRVLASHAPVAWGDRKLHIVVIPEPARQVIGVFAGDGVSDRVQDVIVALGRIYATAVNQAHALRDNQRIIDAMVEELRPDAVALPPGYSVGHLYRSATAGVAIGGDLYDWFRTDRGDLGVAIGDVSGKGIQAASRTAMTVHSLRAFALPGASPHVATSMLNTVVSGRSSTESFVTLVYLRVNPQTAGIDFVLAGHPPPILLSDDGITVVDAEADVPIGVDASAVFRLQHTTLHPGQTLLLYTDGVTEARSADGGALLGMSGLVAMLEDLRHAPAQEIADGVWQGVQDYTGGDTTDDVAVVALQRER